MGLLLAGVGMLMLWLMATGRLRRLTFSDRAAGAIAIVGAALLLSGKGAPGAVMVTGASVYFAMFRHRLWNRGRNTVPPPSSAPPPADPMSVGEACDLLGVAPDADAVAIRAAHRRLIALTHPDRGGTNGLAARINDARDLLLARQERI